MLIITNDGLMSCHVTSDCPCMSLSFSSLRGAAYTLSRFKSQIIASYLEGKAKTNLSSGYPFGVLVEPIQIADCSHNR